MANANAAASPNHATPLRLSSVDSVIEQAIQEGTIPGAVLLVGHNGRVIYRKAYGTVLSIPTGEPMTLDTIFDLASLTKVIATTTAVMQLVERGKLRLNDPVAKYLPEFAQNGKQDITIRQLLTHYSGLAPDLDLKTLWEGKLTGYNMAFAETPQDPPGSNFSYSDINFIVLGALVERVSGETLDEYSTRHIFAPLKMFHTRFLPPAAWRPKIAPTQYDENDHMLRGVVHDPTVRRMGGVAGQAGLFSTADDLAKFAQALLNGGDGILSPASVEKMTSPQQPPVSAGAARLRLGYRFSLFLQPRRPPTYRRLRPHRIHRNISMDRSCHANLHHPADECRPPARQKQRHRAALQSRNRRGCRFIANRIGKRCAALANRDRL